MVDYTNYLSCRYMLNIDIFISKDECCRKTVIIASAMKSIANAKNSMSARKSMLTDSSTAAFIHTTAVTSHEVSIPAFLQKQYDSDFSIGQFIAKGGGGKVYHCNSHNDEITARSLGGPLAIKIVCEDESHFRRVKLGAS